MMQTKIINIGKDFSKFPGGRVYSDGPYCGQAFREKFLMPALNQGDMVEVILDTAEGYGSSFLEECFGGLVRNGKSVEFIKEHLKFQYSNKAYEFYEEEIWQYIQEASINV